MPNKPTTVPQLDTNKSNRTIPAPSKVSDGFLTNDVLPAPNANYLWGWMGDWLGWLDSTFGDGAAPGDLVINGGNVGIGVSPTTKLDVAGNARFGTGPYVTIPGYANQIDFSLNSTNYIQATHASGSLRFRVGGGIDAIDLATTGRARLYNEVGIGIAPASNTSLHVSRNVADAYEQGAQFTALISAAGAASQAVSLLGLVDCDIASGTKNSAISNFASLDKDGAGTLGVYYGHRSFWDVNGGVVNDLRAFHASGSVSSGTVTDLDCFTAACTVAGGAVTNYRGFLCENSTGAPSSQYGVRVENLTSGSVDNVGVYVAGASGGSGNNYSLWVDSGVSRLDGYASIGDTTPSTTRALRAGRTVPDGLGGFAIEASVSVPDNSSGEVGSLYSLISLSNGLGESVADARGHFILVNKTGAGDITSCHGIRSWLQFAGGGTITSAANYYALGSASTCDITNAYGYYFNPLSVTTGTITNMYGVYVGAPSTAINNYGVYIGGGGTYALWVDSGTSRFDGDVSVGTGPYVSVPGGGSAYDVRFSRNSANYITAFDAAGSLVLRTGGENERLTISAAGIASFTGNVGVGTPSPDSALHVYAGASGLANPIAGTLLTIEDNVSAYLSMIVPATAGAGLVVGDPGDADAGRFVYRHDHTSPGWTADVQSNLRLKLDNNARMFLGYAEDWSTSFTGASVVDWYRTLCIASNAAGDPTGISFLHTDGSWFLTVDGDEVSWRQVVGANRWIHLTLGANSLTGGIMLGDPALGSSNYVAIGKLPDNSDGVLQLNLATADLDFMNASTTGTVSGTQTGWIQVKVGGLIRYIPCYTATA